MRSPAIDLSSVDLRAPWKAKTKCQHWVGLGDIKKIKGQKELSKWLDPFEMAT